MSDLQSFISPRSPAKHTERNTARYNPLAVYKGSFQTHKSTVMYRVIYF